MFAYCLNNPVNSSDPTGQLPWAIIAAGLIGGGAASLSSFLDGNSGWQIIKDGVTGALVATILAAYPDLAVAAIGFGMMHSLMECYYQGLTFEESLLYLGITFISELSFPQTGNDSIDVIIDAVYGTSKNILCQLGANAVLDNNSNVINPEVATCHIFSMLSVASSGGGGMGITAICFDYVGGQSLCYRQ